MRLSEASKGFGDPAFFTPRRGIHMIAQGRAQRRSREAPPWVNGPRHAPRPERAKHSGGVEHATILHPKPPTIWFSCRPVRRKNQDAAYREAARIAVRGVTQGGAERRSRRPGLIGPRLAALCSDTKFSGAAKREQCGAKKKLLPDQFFNGPPAARSPQPAARCLLPV